MVVVNGQGDNLFDMSKDIFDLYGHPHFASSVVGTLVKTAASLQVKRDYKLYSIRKCSKERSNLYLVQVSQDAVLQVAEQVGRMIFHYVKTSDGRWALVDATFGSINDYPIKYRTAFRLVREDQI